MSNDEINDHTGKESMLIWLIQQQDMRSKQHLKRLVLCPNPNPIGLRLRLSIINEVAMTPLCYLALNKHGEEVVPLGGLSRQVQVTAGGGWRGRIAAGDGGCGIEIKKDVFEKMISI